MYRINVISIIEKSFENKLKFELLLSITISEQEQEGIFNNK